MFGSVEQELLGRSQTMFINLYLFGREISSFGTCFAEKGLHSVKSRSPVHLPLQKFLLAISMKRSGYLFMPINRCAKFVINIQK
jgi:hypothetical protein